MELKLIEEDKEKLKIEIKGEGHTFCNLLRDELWNDKSVKAAGYAIEHALMGEPRLLIEASNPVKALQGAIDRLRKKNDEFRSMVKELKIKQ